MPTPNATATRRRDTGFFGWGHGGKDPDSKNETESSAIESSARASDPDLNYAHVDGRFEFGGILVNLVTCYEVHKSIPGVSQIKSIPGVIQITVSKTISEWNTLRTLNHINIVGFDDNNPSFSNWMPTNADGHVDDPKGRCELYISKPPLSVSVAAASAQCEWSVLDAHRMCKDILNALKFLADHNLHRGEFTTDEVLVTEDGFKLANIHLCEAVGATTNVRDLRSVGQILREALIGKSSVPGDVEWFGFYTVIMKNEEIAFNAYRDVLPRLLSENWPKSRGETSSQNDRLRGIAYLVSQGQRNTFKWP